MNDGGMVRPEAGVSRVGPAIAAAARTSRPEGARLLGVNVGTSAS